MIPKPPSHHVNAGLLLRTAFVTLVAIVGCSRADRLHRVSGRVTFGGQAVPAGQIYFIPDTTRGNRAPAGFAIILDGHYDTHRDSVGKGVIGGAYQIRIDGHSGNFEPNAAEPSPETASALENNTLFRDYVTTAELPPAESTQDFDVPLSAAASAHAP